MKINNLIKLFLLISLISFNSYANNKELPYNHTRHIFQKQVNWMSSIDDEEKLFRLSLIGTHGSAAKHGGFLVKNQTLTIRQQLDAGIRLFDLRLGQWRNKLYLYHGIIYQKKSFVAVLKDMKTFLRDNPTEVLVVRIRQERSARYSDISFADNVLREVQDYKEYFYQRNKSLNQVTLKDLRKKIVLLRDFNSQGELSNLGYKYSINHHNFVVNDKHHLNSPWDLYDKWKNVKSAMLTASNKKHHSQYRNKTFVTFLSGNGFAFPYFVASGKWNSGTWAHQQSTGLTTPAFKAWYPDFPRKHCWWGMCTIYFAGTNQLTYKHIKQDKMSFVGWVFADFPGPGLIKRVIELNPKTASNRQPSKDSAEIAPSGISGNKPSKKPSCKSQQFRVCFYEHKNYTGKEYCYTKTAGHSSKKVSWVGWGANDKWSSYKLTTDKAVDGVLNTCQHSSHRGRCYDRTENKVHYISNQNDDISSFTYQCNN